MATVRYDTGCDLKKLRLERKRINAVKYFSMKNKYKNVKEKNHDESLKKYWRNR
jgi:hypothetical protein